MEPTSAPVTPVSPTPTPLSGNIETLLFYKGKDLENFTDEELLINFKECFDFEKSYRDAAGLIKAESSTSKDLDSEETNLKIASIPRLSSKEKNAIKRKEAMLELMALSKELGIGKK